ncbi:branched chain keto acid dehydrogenase E1, alpha polypeptide [Reticulomyxa filosa]|uniref:2-oxoisovalerate dehydrogenase subunit alpha n=1 Tax=Reticulomyxa filosa TaxID=46433 RepID=X6NMG8_RETFI|nr:branched chain keto acid dehydrogenase E1, alpha polypeptide [Reticulomyxa filosa]|eukprot:ETO26597.1 branched chain keto acid dehydrogenase E1, alpha polypeptide [Reticulomyxa filosa]
MKERSWQGKTNASALWMQRLEHGHHFFTFIDTNATSEAAGTGYALKRSKKKAVCVCYFGDGAASEGDAHAAFNFSATTESPVIWFCRNNGFAISTPTQDQYRGDGIVARASGYGMLGIRVDGNDVFAVYEVSKSARKMAIEQSRPVLIEAMTYRGSHHSTSDDASRYREKAQQDWWNDIGNPIKRLRNFLTLNGLWDEQKEKDLHARLKAEIDATAKKGESCPKAHWKYLFEDVYDTLPPNLIKYVYYFSFFSIAFLCMLKQLK